MSSPYVTLGNRTLDQWKVTELREELKKRKLTTKGLKEDLVKRLDEAVRTERESALESENNDALESENNDVAESEITPKQTVKEPVTSGRAKDVGNVGIDMGEKVDEKSLNEVNVVEEQVANVETTDIISEKVDPVTPLSGVNVHSDVVNVDGDSIKVINNDGLPPQQEDAKLELSDPSNQLPINDQSSPVGPPSGPNIQGSETGNEAAPSTIQMESDDSKVHQTDSGVLPLKYQVSEADPNLGLQVTSDSVSTESVSIIEKNELKVDVITDNVQLEVDVKHQRVQPSPSIAVQDGVESHPMDVEEPLRKKEYEEPLDKKDVEEPVDKKDCEEPVVKKDFEEPLDKKYIEDPLGGSDTGTLDSLKNTDSGDLGPHEKLNLDRSSGDDSMEEDVLESKQMEYKSRFNKFNENAEKSGMPIVKEDELVDVVSQDKPVEMKVSNVENDAVNASTSVKRKFHDKEAVGNNEPTKKVRRWNAEGLKSSETQSGGIVTSVTPKGSSEPTFKRSGSDLAVNEEAPKERIVPPSSKPPTDSLRIDRFLRPFTLKAVQELLGKTGNVTSFWMDHIKTHCYVSYSSVEEAVETRNAVYNLQWPPNGGRLLVAEFVDPQEVKARLEAPLPSPATPSSTTQPQPSPRQQILRQQVPPPSLPPPPLSNPPTSVRERLREPLPKEQPLPARERITLPPPPPLPEKVDPPIVTLDDLFRKTKAMPRIYYLPLSDEQVATKLKTQGKNVINQ